MKPLILAKIYEHRSTYYGIFQHDIIIICLAFWYNIIEHHKKTSAKNIMAIQCHGTSCTLCSLSLQVSNEVYQSQQVSPLPCQPMHSRNLRNQHQEQTCLIDSSESTLMRASPQLEVGTKWLEGSYVEHYFPGNCAAVLDPHHSLYTNDRVVVI